MTLAPERSHAAGPGSAGPPDATVLVPGAQRPRAEAGAQPWIMAAAVAVAVAGAALGLNGVLRGWAWLSPVMTTVIAVAFTMAALRSLRAPAWLVPAGGLGALAMVLTFTFFRQHSFAGFIPSDRTVTQLGKFLRRASETVLAETAPVAPNAGIVMVICAALGLLVVLVDALAFPLAMPATSGLAILAILVVPAMVKPQSVGVPGFLGAAVGYLLILGCSQWFTPGRRFGADVARVPGQLSRGAVTGAFALALTLLLQAVIPGFDQGTFPQGSRLNPFGSASGLNPMISLGNSLRAPSGEGRITFATNAPRTPYLRSVTVDSFDGDAWSPDDRESTRRLGTGRMESGLEAAPSELRILTAVDTNLFTSPYAPAPYAPESVSGLTGRWSWDPATLSIKGIDTNSRNQQYLVTSTVPQLSAEFLAQSSAPIRGVGEQFVRPPASVPPIVRSTAETVTAQAGTAYGRAMAIQKYLRSSQFSYSLQSPVQGGYDGNGLAVLADFLDQKSGYCIHFASAMAVMARLVGIPSRIAVGYAPGRPTGATVAVPGQGALPEFEVDARDAHAWPELYFQGAGWVAFEPTPSRGVVPEYAVDAAPSTGASTNADNSGLIPEAGSEPVPADAVPPVPVPGTAGTTAGNAEAAQPYGALAALSGAFLAVLLILSPRLARRSVRRRRLPRPGHHGGPAPAGAAWAELSDLAADYGIPPAGSETPRLFARRLGASPALGTPDRDDPAVAALAALTSDIEREQYGRPRAGLGSDGTGAAADRIGALETSLQANARLGVRLRAQWLPPSVLTRWRGSAQSFAADFDRLARRLRAGAARGWSGTRGAARRLLRG